MSNVITCSQCHGAFRMKDELAGKRARCPHCHALLHMPPLAPRAAERQAAPSGQATAAPEPARQAAAEKPTQLSAGQEPAPLPSRRQLVGEILGGFQGGIEAVELPWSYHFGIFLVAAAMIAVPIVYVLIIGLVCCLVCLHAVYGLGVLDVESGRAGIFVLLLYLGPMIAGGILVVFMIKPLFARNPMAQASRSITPQSEPLVFAFVERICSAVEAPVPTRIDVNVDVNAAAGFRRGVWSMFGSSDLVLTIGLPLVAGLDTRQFAGVLAHEFGHFTQGAGMRLTYLTRAISHWLTRVVYERDQWDEWLERSAARLDVRLGIVLHVARLCIWLTRRVLWVLMLAGHAVSGFMLRQMEFDADRFEARLAGSEAFESTARRLMVLSVAMQGAQADLREFYKEGRLGDDLPRLIMANVDQIPAELRKRLDAMIDESTTGLLDTHPADRERIAGARREDTPGIFQVEYPAQALFAYFERLSKAVTFDFYRAVFGSEFQPSDMHPVEELLTRQGEQEEAGKALRRYFQGAFTPIRPLLLPPDPGPPADPRQCLARIKQARLLATEEGQKYAKTAARYDELDSRLVEIDQAVALLEAHFTIQAKDFSIPLTGVGAAEFARAQAIGQMDGLALGLADFEEETAGRLLCAVQLLHVPKLAARIGKAGQWRAEYPRLLAALRQLNKQHAALLELRNARAVLAVLVGNLEQNEENEALRAGIGAQMKAVLKQVLRIRHALSEAAYPFDHAKGPTTMGEYALPGGIDEDNLGAIFAAGGAVLENLSGLIMRVASRLAAIAEGVESVLGLPPLAEPPEAEASQEASSPRP